MAIPKRSRQDAFNRAHKTKLKCHRRVPCITPEEAASDIAPANPIHGIVRTTA